MKTKLFKLKTFKFINNIIVWQYLLEHHLGGVLAKRRPLMTRGGRGDWVNEMMTDDGAGMVRR